MSSFGVVAQGTCSHCKSTTAYGFNLWLEGVEKHGCVLCKLIYPHVFMSLY